ncbi:MAG: D-TA family PLP-dependent enzyme [Verrucomicrobia bacterium]|nr:D-TA family PLP-dependent enzyme [Verrucomicrobiota bacterium]
MLATWFPFKNVDDVSSPALLVYPDRIEENIRRMIAIAGGVERLRPHIKTHKLAEVVRMQMNLGITKFKCATIAEAEMAAICGAPDVMLAYQPVGPNVDRLLELAARFPSVRFSCLADNAASIGILSDAAARSSARLEVLLDLDLGQHRTGVADGKQAFDLYRLISSLPALKPGGFHAYDGHINDPDLTARTTACESAFAPVELLRRKLERENLPVPRIVAGGTPTFPIHARRPDVECSPGTCVFWDAGYATKLPDLDFLHAALVLTRVISKLRDNLFCLDLGHKAIAAEMPHPRVQFLNLPDAKAITHSEEHLVVETTKANGFAVGDCLFGIPWHICPTVALHSEAVVVEEGRATQRWRIVARERKLTI